MILGTVRRRMPASEKAHLHYDCPKLADSVHWRRPFKFWQRNAKPERTDEIEF